MTIRTIVMAALAAACACSPAVAAGSTEQRSISRYVLSHSTDFLKQSLAPEQLASLHLAAYSAAAASACGDIELDEVKFMRHFERLAHKAEAKMTAEQKLFFERQLMLSYGVAIGAFLAEAGQGPDQFCDEAKAFKDQNQAVVLWK
jgi:hypothetical protein